MTKWMRAIATALIAASWRDAGWIQTTMSRRSAGRGSECVGRTGRRGQHGPVVGGHSATSYNLYWSDASPVTKSSAVIKGVASPYEHKG